MTSYKSSRNVELSGKYRGLMREAYAAGIAVTTELQRAADLTAAHYLLDAGHTLQPLAERSRSGGRRKPRATFPAREPRRNGRLPGWPY